jgi:hypothetical protein
VFLAILKAMSGGSGKQGKADNSLPVCKMKRGKSNLHGI